MTGKDIIRRYDSMDDYVRGNWEQLWQECADWCWPSNDNINRIRTPGEEKPPQRMIDTCIEANHAFASGVFSNLFPPNTVWAKFRHPLPSMMDNDEVADYFERVSREVHRVMVSSNFSQEEFQALLALGCFGSNSVAVEPDDDKIVRFTNFVIGKVKFDVNHRGEVDTIGREFELDGRQSIQRFGESALEKAGLRKIIEAAKHNKSDKFCYIHLVTPRMSYDKDKMDKKNKKFADYYVCRDGDILVKEGGHDLLPYKTGRFTVGNDEIYGRGPMSMVLGTARRSNVIYRDLMVSAEEHSKPRWLIPDDDSVKFSRYFIKYRANNPNGKPERLPPNGDPSTAMEMYQMHDEQIRRMFFNHLFRPLDEYRNMTATEVQERMTTDMMSLAPFVSRYVDEHVSPLMEHVYYLCKKARILPEEPEILKQNPMYEIDYVGRLSLATKSYEVLGAINSLRIVGELGQMSPKILSTIDNVDADKFFKQLWFSQSSSMNALKRPDDVEKEREAAAAAAQQQRAIDNLAPVADAAQKMSGEVSPNSLISKITGE